MLALILATFDPGLWNTWMPLGAGAAVTGLVLGSTVLYERWRRRHRLAEVSREEDLPWENLLFLLEKRNRDRAAVGLPAQEATEAEMEQLLAELPGVGEGRPLELPEDREFQLTGGAEQRTTHRRWGNPTNVFVAWPDSDNQLHGLVVNRSTGGLGILVDREIPPNTFVNIRAVEAPAYVPAVCVEVRHCLKAGRAFILGCQFSKDIPWNVRVWFG